MAGSLATHSWLGLVLLLGAGGLLFLLSLASGKLRLQLRVARRLAARPRVFWPLVAFIAAGRLALMWAVLAGRANLG